MNLSGLRAQPSIYPAFARILAAGESLFTSWRRKRAGNTNRRTTEVRLHAYDAQKHRLAVNFDFVNIGQDYKRSMRDAINHFDLELLKGHRNMIANPAQITRHHLANQAAPAYSLIRKVCACGKASIAKQLAQHGKCAACALTAVRAAIMPGDFAKLQHMLGAVQGKPKNRWGYRNYYCANSSGAAREAMQRLVDAGLAAAGHESDTQAYFHATHLGCKAAGLDAPGIKRAMED
ncbi:hypothetical protein [Janthinobacterium sp. DSP2-3-3]|uniref:hypothetical protein n=1 Tax=Janthinobacterium sp. DSP2-3-3 TaxID=2804596 RepID=UPI003CF356CB